MIALAAVVAVFTAIGLGAERRFGDRADRLGQRLMSFLLWVVLPVVAFFNIASLELSVPVGAGIGFAFLAHLTSFGLAYAVGTRVLRLERPAVGSLMLVAGLSNSGFLGLPFVTALFGFDQLPLAVVYDVVSLTLLVTVGFSIGAAFGTVGERPRDRVLSFFARNPALYASVAGLLAPAVLAPDWAVDASRVLVLATVPIGFFAVGVVLSAEARTAGTGFPPPITRPVAAAVLLKLAVPPAVLFALSATLVEVPGTYLSQAAMAAGIQTLVVSSTYGLDRALTAAAIAWSTVLVLAVG
ncbi:MAG: AEC family transporter, partial [Thermoleophilaceae bacterium]